MVHALSFELSKIARRLSLYVGIHRMWGFHLAAAASAPASCVLWVVASVFHISSYIMCRLKMRSCALLDGKHKLAQVSKGSKSPALELPGMDFEGKHSAHSRPSSPTATTQPASIKATVSTPRSCNNSTLRLPKQCAGQDVQPRRTIHRARRTLSSVGDLGTDLCGL